MHQRQQLSVKKRGKKWTTHDSNDVGTSKSLFKTKDCGRPKHPNITMKFPPLSLRMIDTAAPAFFVRGACPDEFRERGVLIIQTVPGVIAVFEGEVKEEDGRILKFLSSNDLRNQRVKVLSPITMK
ncbi:hypothetical protein AVEN_51468-1 [Araneus ventricosus]|uniref:Uncharacterized protein n=1 Tax=Araneus ventricosus TaxID=182803 RepID=A0A4Y2D4Q8_ARAVE|nr:hypothetical protein AVEN_51468-1 [Araneus ventricosus]